MQLPVVNMTPWALEVGNQVIPRNRVGLMVYDPEHLEPRVTINRLNIYCNTHEEAQSLYYRIRVWVFTNTWAEPTHHTPAD